MRLLKLQWQKKFFSFLTLLVILLVLFHQRFSWRFGESDDELDPTQTKDVYLKGKELQLPFSRVFLVNRVVRIDRLLQSLQVLKRAGLTLAKSSFEVVDAQDLAFWQIQEASKENGLAPGVTACYASHLHVIRRVITQNLASALVLEDDLDLPLNALEHLKPLLSPFFQKAGKKLEWDILYLGNCYEKQGPPDQSVSQSGPYAFNPSINPECTHGYAVSNAGARKILSHIEKNLSEINSGIDWALRDLVQAGLLKSYSIFPSLIIQYRDSPSDLRDMGEFVEQPIISEGDSIIAILKKEKALVS